MIKPMECEKCAKIIPYNRSGMCNDCATEYEEHLAKDGRQP